MAKTKKKAVKKSAKKKAPAKKAAPKKVAKKVVKKAAKKQAKTQPKKTGKKFLIIYHAPPEAMEQTMNITPEQQAEGMAMWRAWAEKVSSRLADLGAPLINGRSLKSNGDSAPSNKEVSGYSLLEAEDWEELMSLLEGHPHLSGWHPEATIEIHETMMLPGM